MNATLSRVRACIFDVDGTLIDTEDIYSEIYNNILREYGRPDYPWKIKAIQQSRGTSGATRLLEWAQVPLTIPEWKAKEKAYTHLFTKSKLLPGVDTLLTDLSTKTSPPVKLALASSAGHHLFDLKTSHLPTISAAFSEPMYHVFGNDPDLANSDKKPSPDIFLIALRRLNDAIESSGEHLLVPEECLVFEDSIAGVEAARRAGMRVVWVPHPGLAAVCRGQEMDVLMGRTEANGEPPKFSDDVQGLRQDQNLSKGNRLFSEDGLAEMRTSLEEFPYQAYGIRVQI